MDVGAMVEMPGGGLTAMVKTIQERPAETKRTIRFYTRGDRYHDLAEQFRRDAFGT